MCFEWFCFVRAMVLAHVKRISLCTSFAPRCSGAQQAGRAAAAHDRRGRHPSDVDLGVAWAYPFHPLQNGKPPCAIRVPEMKEHTLRKEQLHFARQTSQFGKTEILLGGWGRKYIAKPTTRTHRGGDLFGQYV